MICYLITAIISTVFLGGAGFLLFALLEHLTGINLFDVFDKQSWKSRPIGTAIKVIPWLMALAILVVSFIVILHGDYPFGETTDSSHWEPAW